MKRYDGLHYISLGRRPGAPKWVPGWCGRGAVAGGVVQFLDKVVDTPVVVQLVDVPVVQVVAWVSSSWTRFLTCPLLCTSRFVVRKTVEVPQLQYLDRVVDVFFVQWTSL